MLSQREDKYSIEIASSVYFKRIMEGLSIATETNDIFFTNISIHFSSGPSTFIIVKI